MNPDQIISTTTDRDADSLTYWGCASPDQPIRLKPFPCGRYVCPNHQYDPAAEIDVTSADDYCPQGVR